jgi:hypothetical protein
MSACSKETLHDPTSEPMLEPNSAVTQLPAAYGFGSSNYTPFQVTAFFVGRTSFSGWGYLHKHKCMRSSWLRTHSFPIELTRLRVTLTPHGFAVSECKHQCTAHEVLHVSEGTFCTMISWWEHMEQRCAEYHLDLMVFGFGEHNILSSLQLLSLSTAYIFFTCVSLHAPYNFYSVHSTVYLLASWMWCLLDNMLYLTCFNIPLNALGPTVV